MSESFGLCLEACCAPPCEICNDETDMTFMLTLSGIVDGGAVDDPPGLGDCLACADLNTTFPLRYLGELSLTQATGCTTLSDPPPFPGIVCAYGGGFEGCGSIDLTEGTFGRSLGIRFYPYLSTGGDVRGYLELTLFSDHEDFLPFPISNTRAWTVSCDFLIESSVETITCADVDVTDTFAVCSDFGTIDCEPPTGFNLYAV